MSDQSRGGFRGQQGVALLAALILVLALVLTMGSIFYRHQIDVATVTRSLHSDQAYLLALSAESWAARALTSEWDDREVDSLEENWAQNVPLLPVEGGFLRACMVDLQARLNVGGFANYDAASWAAEIEDAENSNGLLLSWLRLLNLLELPASEVQLAALIDWTDAGNEPINQWGAEQSDYDFERTLRQVPNRRMTDIEELALVRGYSMHMVSQLRPWIAALPRTTAVNINTADEAVLLAIGAGHASAFADLVMTERPFFDVSELQQRAADHLGISLNEAARLWPEQLVSVNSDYFQLQISVSLGESELELYSTLSRYGRDAPVVISRSLNIVPAILPDAVAADAGPGFCQTAELST